MRVVREMNNFHHYKLLTVITAVLICVIMAFYAAKQELAAAEVEVATANSEYQAHLGHIEKSWHETPDAVGLLAILSEEAQIAHAHAGYAITDVEDYDNIRLHIPHVRHAISTASETGGPGKGFGVERAAQGVADHMDYARNTSDATDSVKLHAEHIITSAKNIVAWSNKIIRMSDQIMGGASPIATSYYAEEVAMRTNWILNGNDADGDGKISWVEGEGGLAQIRQHLGFIEREG